MIEQALDALPGLVVSVFLVFCRIGGCLMLVPGFGSARIPVQIRLFFSIGASIAVFAVLGELQGVSQNATDLTLMARLAGVEAAKGIFIGFLVRFFFASLQFMGEAAAASLNIGRPIASPEDREQLPALAAIISVTATTLFFVTDLHLELLRALVQSYNVFRFGAEFGKSGEVAELSRVLTAASFLALQVCSPFLIFALLVNLLFGILNKLAPMIPVVFVSPPFVIGGGLLLFYFIVQDFFSVFMTRFSDWLISG